MHNESKNVPDQKTRSNLRGSLRKRAINIQAPFEACLLDLVAEPSRAARVKAQRGHVPMGVTAHGSPRRAFAV
jgi:hypothetical protein